ncbi:MAG: energy-coupling factor transporter transmembrane component T family protein [Coprococcus sp.]
MIRDITIGQYYPGSSVIHRLDPRVKLLGTVLFVISVFLISSVPAFLIVTAALVGMIAISGVPLRFMLKGLKAIFMIIMLTFFFSLFLTPGDLLFRLGFLKATVQGLKTGVYMVMRLSYLIIGSSLMTLTTTPNQLTDGLEKGLGFLNRVHIPVHEVAMMMSIALRFIPILLEEMDRIMKAQQARGADFESGNLIQRAKGLVPLLVPLFIAAIRRANDLAMAMEARCYHGGEGRTKMKPLRYEKKDYIAYILILIYMAFIITLRIMKVVA